jgi:excisionase family DNA binding protein
MEKPLPELMTPGEVGAKFRVSPKTVSRWARQGLLPEVLTPGGHRRYRRGDVETLWKKANPEQ